MFGAAIMSLMFLGACKNEGKKDEAATVSTELARRIWLCPLVYAVIVACVRLL